LKAYRYETRASFSILVVTSVRKLKTMSNSNESSDSMDLQKLLAALASGARAVQGLPSSQEDFDYEISFPEFGGTPLQSTRAKWLELVQSILHYPGLLSIHDVNDFSDDFYDNLEDPLLWDECAEACEILMEQINELQNDIADSSSSATATLQQVSNTARGNATSQWSRMHAMLVADLPKPQDVYPHLLPPVPGNARTVPFVPRVHPDKPFGIVPLPVIEQQLNASEGKQSLQLRLEPGHGLESRFGPIRSSVNINTIPHDIVAPTEHCPHLYEVEINSFLYSENQLKADDGIRQEKGAIPAVLPLQAIWIDTVHDLEKFVETWNDENVSEVAVDLEAHSYRSFSGIICLMQMTVRLQGSGECQNYLIDTLILKRHDVTRLLAPIFANPAIVKVFHGADHDVTWLQRDFGIYVVNLFDTGRAARALSFQSAAYAYLLKRYCSDDLVIDKSLQLADWRQRPLSEAMQQYAIQDTHYLLEIYERLKVELFDSGGVEMIQEVLDTSRKVCLIRYMPEPFKPSGYKALMRNNAGNKGRRRQYHRKTNIRTELNRRQERVLHDLWDWRDHIARQYDESVQYVCTNQALLRLSLASTSSVAQLQALFHPLPPLLLQHSQDIVRIIQKASVQADEETEEQLNQSGQDADPDDENNDADTEYDVDELGVDDEEIMKTNVDTVNSNDVGYDETLKQIGGNGTSSSAFFKPSNLNETDHGRRRGMMSPVMGTEALYKQAGWMTPQEQLQHKMKHQLEFSTSTSTDIGGTNEQGNNKPRRLLSVHASNKEYDSKQYTEHNLEVGTSNIAPVIVISTERRGRANSLDGMGPVRVASGCSSLSGKSVDEATAKVLAMKNASRIRVDLTDSVPVVLSLVPSTPGVFIERHLVDDDEGTDDGRGISSDKRKSMKDSKGEEDENEIVQTDECFVIPKSIREIYQISNRNRRNKKTGSPTPEREVTPTNQKEQDEMMKAEALLKQRGLLDEDGSSYLFEDNPLGSSPGKRPRAKSGRESEESVPENPSNTTSKEDDLAFMKEVGWIKSEDDVDDILNQRYGKSRLSELNDADIGSSGVEDLEGRGDATMGSVRVGNRSPYEYSVGASSSPAIGLIQPGQSLSANNPFFSGSAMLGGPLTQQGLTKHDSLKGRKNGPGKGKQHRGRQQEQSEKRGDRTFAFRKK
jgi:exosome complex exonuclease RRP6